MSTWDDFLLFLVFWVCHSDHWCISKWKSIDYESHLHPFYPKKNTFLHIYHRVYIIHALVFPFFCSDHLFITLKVFQVTTNVLELVKRMKNKSINGILWYWHWSIVKIATKRCTAWIVYWLLDNINAFQFTVGEFNELFAPSLFFLFASTR